MSVRRKSNWYIYAITFAITLALALVAIFTFRQYLFPTNTTSVGLNERGEPDANFKPTAEHNASIMLMFSDNAEDSPELFVLAEYSAVENRLAFIPIPSGISVASESRNLTNIYTAQGGNGVINAINNILGVKCDTYVKMDRKGFINFVTGFGSVEYDIAKTIIIRDGIESEIINAGSQNLTAESIFRLAMCADFEEGEAYRFNVVGGLLSDLVNQNFRNIDGTLMDIFYRSFNEISENNLSEQKYKAHKAALLYTVEYGSYPAEYYVPYGEYTEDGGFTISENSITTIRQKAE